MVCSRCNGTGVDETGNNDLPCDCPAGATALFNVAGVRGPVTGAEVSRHFLNGSPEPLRGSFHDPVCADTFPGRARPVSSQPPAMSPSPPKKRSKERWQV